MKNTGKNTLNSIVVTGLAAARLHATSRRRPLSASTVDRRLQPDAAGLHVPPSLRAGKSLPPIVFYYTGPTVVGTQYPFKVEVKVSEGGKDNSDGTANNIDTFFSEHDRHRRPRP